VSDWTLGAVRARGMQLEASCKNESCRRFYVFDLDQLIGMVGADYPVSDIPAMTCDHCAGPLKIELAMGHHPGGSS
jgi:hypothetical protein